MKVLVTGANGFVGRALCSHLVGKGYTVRGTVRDKTLYTLDNVELFSTGNLSSQTDWSEALQGVDCVFHLAGTVHQPHVTDAAVYQSTIYDATKKLAQQALDAHVKRFVYVSTSHVYGVEASDQVIKENHKRAPLTAYGQAKSKAEEELQKFQNLPYVIVRPPLVYGPGVRGNFLQLVKLVKRFSFLPLKGAQKTRSFVGLRNLVSFLEVCAQDERAVHQVFNISDGNDLSTYELCKKIANGLHKDTYFVNVPSVFFRFAFTLVAKHSFYTKLFESVNLDLSNAKNLLSWTPPFTVEEEIKAALGEP